MVLSNRERYIFFGMLAVVGLLALNYVILSPWLDARSQAETRRSSLLAKVRESNNLIALRGQIAPKWGRMVQAGMKSDITDAETQMFGAIQDWTGQAGVKLLQQKKERSAQKTRLPEVKFELTCLGSVDALRKMLLAIQGATIPVRVMELTVDSKEGASDLTFKITLTTIYAPAKLSAAIAGGSSRPGGN